MSQVGVYFYPNRSQADYSEPLQLQILGLKSGTHEKGSRFFVGSCRSERTFTLRRMSGSEGRFPGYQNAKTHFYPKRDWVVSIKGKYKCKHSGLREHFRELLPGSPRAYKAMGDIA